MLNGGYDLEGIIWHSHSPYLMKQILTLWPDKNIPVVDIGCGMNYYCSVLEYNGYKAVGFDAANLKAVDVVADVTKPISKIWDQPTNVISLEVGEHIPEELSQAYIDNLCSFGGDIIMSWAVPGQAGIGHINCQTNNWVINEMLKRGKKLNILRTKELREAVLFCKCDWFKNTLLYFEK